jgi:ribA/ribD-fused uncharacterized protein
MTYDKASLIESVRKGNRPRYVFFWGHKSRHTDGRISKEVFSQWWVAPFEIEGQRYASAEHWMMAEKARLFGDEVARIKILAASSPGQAKSFGRTVNGFDEQVWQAHRFGIVVAGNLAKFSQHEALKTFLLTTGNKVLVEASPVDRIWGIGMSVDDPQVENPEEWRGMNLLGFALMVVREQLLVG